MISKRRLINTLFLVAFPMYGVGLYRAFSGTVSSGLVFGLLPFLMILAIHGIDLIYRTHVRIVVNRVYWIGLFFLLSLAGANWHAYFMGFPGFNIINTTVYSIVFLVPFHAAMVVQIHNRENDEFDFSWLVLKGMLLLMLVNLFGYARGLRNMVHYFEGRISLPYLGGMYDTAHILAMVNLMLLFYIKDPVRKPIRFVVLSLVYVAALGLMLNVNSRLSFMMFIVLTFLFLLRLVKGLKLLYSISLFTMPLLMSFALLIYQILTLPIFAKIVSRVDKEDVTTFNSRTYIWESAWEWLLDDRRGFLFGNGHQGQYRLGMMDKIAVIWDTDQPFDIHMHSTFLQIVMAQGVVGYLLFCSCMWYAYSFYRRKYLAGSNEAPLFAAILYLLFIWQIDIFVNGWNIGNPMFFCMLSYLAIDRAYVTRTPMGLDGRPLERSHP